MRPTARHIVCDLIWETHSIRCLNRCEYTICIVCISYTIYIIQYRFTPEATPNVDNSASSIGVHRGRRKCITPESNRAPRLRLLQKAPQTPVSGSRTKMGFLRMDVFRWRTLRPPSHQRPEDIQEPIIGFLKLLSLSTAILVLCPFSVPSAL